MRSLLFALLLGAAAPAVAAPTPVPLDAPAKSTSDFPVPKDAGAPEAAPGGGGKILLYKIPRGRAAVVAEVKSALGAPGWTITKSTESPSGNAIRIEVKHGDKLFKVSFTGDDTRTAMILTLP
jgi:hypothetical protein